MTNTTQALIDAAMADPTRKTTIPAIRAALRERSGKTWSVTGGTGTAYGWITISAPPKRLERYSMTEADRAELGELLGLGRPAHHQGESIPAAHDFRRLYVTRAATGATGGLKAEVYWD